MGKAIVYIALIVVCLGTGVLIGGAAIYYTNLLKMEKPKTLSPQDVYCYPMENGYQGEGESKITGEIKFSQVYGKKIYIDGNVQGLENGKHGFHIHTYGIMHGDCATAAGHYNPLNMTHGSPNPNETDHRHVGDLGNIETVNKMTTINIKDEHASLFDKYSILGRSIVIHEKEDTYDDPSSAGPRIACCTIGIKYKN